MFDSCPDSCPEVHDAAKRFMITSGKVSVCGSNGYKGDTIIKLQPATPSQIEDAEGTGGDYIINLFRNGLFDSSRMELYSFEKEVSIGGIVFFSKDAYSSFLENLIKDRIKSLVF